jgi:hypothetical protein
MNNVCLYSYYPRSYLTLAQVTYNETFTPAKCSVAAQKAVTVQVNILGSCSSTGPETTPPGRYGVATGLRLL